MSQPDPANPCFGCGGGNPRGMNLLSKWTNPASASSAASGWARNIRARTGFIHGGIIATVLDEVMSKVSRFSNVRAVTAELTVEYLKPVRVDEELRVEGFHAAARAGSCIMKGRFAMPPESAGAGPRTVCGDGPGAVRCEEAGGRRKGEEVADEGARSQ